jgi:hypothetical protein
MKKLLNKIRSKASKIPESTRITTETIAHHRERILAGGRRFKYPVQYARHKLVFNAIIITFVTLLALISVGYWQLYSSQSTGSFTYRVTRVLPLPAASIDGQTVRYSDYLMKYRSSIHYLETKERVNLQSEDGERQSDFVKQQAMDDALADAYAAKLAKASGVTVTDADLEVFLTQQRQSSDGAVTQATYEAVILDYYDWSPSEYEHAMKTKLLRQKVSFEIDQTATTAVDKVGAIITAGTTDLKKVTEEVNKASEFKVSYAAPGWVPKTNQDGGLATAATGLEKGAISVAIKSTSGEGYYYIKLLDKNDTQVRYESVFIPLTEFDKRFIAIKDSEKVKIYITIPEVATIAGSEG